MLYNIYYYSAVATIWPNEFPDLNPSIPGWDVPWGVPH